MIRKDFLEMNIFFDRRKNDYLLCIQCDLLLNCIFEISTNNELRKKVVDFSNVKTFKAGQLAFFLLNSLQLNNIMKYYHNIQIYYTNCFSEIKKRLGISFVRRLN